MHAAGAVLHRGGTLAVVHRPRYDDWTLPKGKLEPGEHALEAALREVREETGWTGEPQRDLGEVRYRLPPAGAVKVVRFYLMRAARPGPRAGDEVDAVAWLTAAEAAGRLTYGSDREVLARAAPLPAGAAG